LNVAPMNLESGSGILAIMALAILRAGEFRPLPLVVLCATLNHEPPVFLMACC
jgi:hypothetical protein